MKRIAFFGLGTMGGPMASHLAASGFDVTGVDIDPDARSRYSGAIPPVEAELGAADLVITMLPEGEHVRDAYERWIFGAALAGAVLIDCSTIDVETARSLNAAASKRGLFQIDAPVSGGPEAAGSGKLSLMVGGREADVALARPVLEALGANVTHFGVPGSGQAAKACHNMICGITAMAVLEGFALAEALGLDPAQFYQLCAGAAAQSWTLENRCPIPGVAPEAPASKGYAPGFAARLMAKDLRLAQAASEAAGQPTPFGAEAARAFSAFAEVTGGDLDYSSYYTRLRVQPDDTGNDRQ